VSRIFQPGSRAGGRGRGEVAQTIYAHVSKYKNYKRRKEKKNTPNSSLELTHLSENPIKQVPLIIPFTYKEAEG
jgi:hypothetical protein